MLDPLNQRRTVLLEELRRCLSDGGMSIAVTPMLDVDDREMVIHWRAKLPNGHTYETIDSPEFFLRLLPFLGKRVIDGWSLMSEVGWSLSQQETEKFVDILRSCAETIEKLSEALPKARDSNEATDE
jgi:hypothetical protein